MNRRSKNGWLSELKEMDGAQSDNSRAAGRQGAECRQCTQESLYQLIA
ncbi:hypothetical protein REC12_08175 [Desulfosporosinus sp. PR]|nr:hypothetical protein [Desulfosporosinus sp. PR]